jgi:hypothetical protein
MQNCELFQTLFRHARRAFWVFQMQHALEDLPELEDITPPGFTQQDPLLKPMPWKRLLAEDSLALPLLDKQPGFTSAYSIGQVSVVAADLRTERSRTQIMGSDTWKQIKEWTDNLQTGGAGRNRRLDVNTCCSCPLCRWCIRSCHWQSYF